MESIVSVWVERVRGWGRHRAPKPIEIEAGPCFHERCVSVAKELYPLDEGERYEFVPVEKRL